MSNPLILKLKKLISDLSIDTENNTSDIEDINSSVASNTSNIQKLKGTVLYEGSGTNSTSITLSDNIQNYKYCEIFYSVGTATGAMASVKALVGKPLKLDGAIVGFFDGFYGIRLIATGATISGKNLTKQQGYAQTLKTDGTMVFSDALNGIYIHKVVGYKE